MAGYAVTARITGATPRRVGSRIGWASGHAVATASRARIDARRPDPIPLDERLAYWWSEARSAWAEGTFFLFDANSWR